MTILVVLFNLKDPNSAAEYERWAREVDVPTVRALESVTSYDALRTNGLFGGGSSPYQYVELIEVHDMRRFGEEIGTAAVQKVGAEFRSFADNPMFILTESLSL